MPFDPLRLLAANGVLAEPDDARCDRLAGGYWNDVFRVRCSVGDLVLKHFGGTRVASTLFPIMPETEAHALQVLEGLGVAPDPFGFWPAGEDHGPVLAYHFVPGSVWQGDMAEAATLLRRVHGVVPDGFRAMAVTPEDVLAHADSVPCPPADDPAWRRLLAVRPAPKAVPALERRALIHGDFSAGNMIAGPRGVRIIDWQCPGAGDPAEDLWSFLAPCFQIVYGRKPWSTDAVARFREAYGEADTLARLDAMTPYFSWRFAAYSVFRTHQLSGVDDAGAERYRRCAEAETALLESTT